MDTGSGQLQINRSDILIDCPVNERPTRGGCGYGGAQANLVMADTFDTKINSPDASTDSSRRLPLTGNVSTPSCPPSCFPARMAIQYCDRYRVSVRRHSVAIKVAAVESSRH